MTEAANDRAHPLMWVMSPLDRPAVKMHGRAMAALVFALCASCSRDLAQSDDAGGMDLSARRDDLALAFPPEPDLSDEGGDLPCPGANPRCHRVEWGPPDHPFPLSTDEMRDPFQQENGIH